jgi:hypothetical protein
MLYPRGTHTVWGASPWGGGVLLVLREARVVRVRDIFILNEIWAQGEIYILLYTLLG